MDKNGQLTFTDDPLLNETSEIYQFISEGKFREAIKKADKLMNVNPEYPGLIEAYRTAKFWSNREKEVRKTEEGKKTADFLMEEWENYEEYASGSGMINSAPYRAAMRFIFFKASNHYKLAFQKNEDTVNKFDLLIRLGECFLRLKEHQYAVETLEYAKNSYSSNARLLFILGESYYHINEIPKSLMNFQEAFLINPAEVDLSLIEARPIREIIAIIIDSGKKYRDIREWIPVYGVIHDIFYIKKNINKHHLEILKSEVYSLENSYVKLSKDEIEETNILPRMLNKYLWLYDYYENQNVNPENTDQIRSRLLNLDYDLFHEYFNSPPHKKRI